MYGNFDIDFDRFLAHFSTLHHIAYVACYDLRRDVTVL